MTQATARVLPPLTPQEYLEWEVEQPLRYEYFNGEVFAMAGGTLPHADIGLNLASLLREPLRGRCKVRNSDARLALLTMDHLPIQTLVLAAMSAIVPPDNLSAIPVSLLRCFIPVRRLTTAVVNSPCTVVSQPYKNMF